MSGLLFFIELCLIGGGSLPVLEGSGKCAVASLVVRWRSHHQKPVAQVRQHLRSFISWLTAIFLHPPGPRITIISFFVWGHGTYFYSGDSFGLYCSTLLYFLLGFLSLIPILLIYFSCYHRFLFRLVKSVHHCFKQKIKFLS